MNLVAKVLFSALALSSAAAAAHAEPLIQLDGQPQLTGDCIDPSTQVTIADTQQGQTFDILVPSMDAEADDAQPRVRKFCNIRQRITIPQGYKLAPNFLTYQGLTDIAQDGGSGNVSARYFLTGTQGVNGFRAFQAGEQGNFDVSTTAGHPQYTQCGGSIELNFLADITARTRPGQGSYSQVTLDRGIGYAKFHCGVQVVPCW